MNSKRDEKKLGVVSDQYGDTIQSATITLTMVEGTKITVQPTDVSVTMANMTARVNIVAEGEGLSYQWYLKNPNATKLSKSSITSDTYSVKMSEVNNGRQVYRVVTDQFGNSVRSDIISLSIKLAIKEQPTDVYARIGEKVSTSVVAEGDGLTYQWYRVYFKIWGIYL